MKHHGELAYRLLLHSPPLQPRCRLTSGSPFCLKSLQQEERAVKIRRYSSPNRRKKNRQKKSRSLITEKTSTIQTVENSIERTQARYDQLWVDAATNLLCKRYRIYERKDVVNHVLQKSPQWTTFSPSHLQSSDGRHEPRVRRTEHLEWNVNLQPGKSFGLTVPNRLQWCSTFLSPSTAAQLCMNSYGVYWRGTVIHRPWTYRVKSSSQ